MNVERTHELIRLMRVLIGLWSDKKPSDVQPLKIQRPGAKAPVLRPADLARRMLGR